jgi:hypothetical protein
MAMNFERVGVFRPAFLLCDRRGAHFGERLVKIALKPVIWASPTSSSVPTDSVAKVGEQSQEVFFYFAGYDRKHALSTQGGCQVGDNRKRSHSRIGVRL